MNVKLGWSGEIYGTWTKMDVEVDENDLRLHFYDAGADPERMRVSPTEKFKLMNAIAEIFVLLHKISRFPEFFNNEDRKKELKDLVTLRDDLTKKIMDRPPF